MINLSKVDLWRLKIYTDATTEEVSLQISSWDLSNTYPTIYERWVVSFISNYQLQCVAWNFFSANMNTLIQFWGWHIMIWYHLCEQLLQAYWGEVKLKVYLPDFVTYVVYITDGRNINN